MAVRVMSIIAGNELNPENPHLNISAFKWINEQTQASGITNREDMYDWIVNKGGHAYIMLPDVNGNRKIPLYGVDSPSGRHYIRAVRDNKWTDDLLNFDKSSTAK